MILPTVRLPEIIPVGGIFSVQVPAVEQGQLGITVMKLKDDEFLKLFNWDGNTSFELIPRSMVQYPISGYYGLFSELWELWTETE